MLVLAAYTFENDRLVADSVCTPAMLLAEDHGAPSIRLVATFLYCLVTAIGVHLTYGM